MKTHACDGRSETAVSSVSEKLCEALQVLAVCLHYLRNIGWHQVDLRSGRIPRRHADARPGRNIAHRDGELLPLIREDEIDEGARRRCVLRGFQDRDRKSTRLNSSHITISYAVFCLKKKK